MTALTTPYFYYGFTVGLLGINGYALNLAEWQLFGDAEKFLELYDNNPQYISTVVNMNLLAGSSIDCPTITQGGLSIGQVAQPYILNSTPNVQKRYMITGTTSTSILMPDGITYFKRDIDLRLYTQTKTIPNPSSPYRLFRFKAWVSSGYFGYLTNSKPNVISYEVFMSLQSQGGGGSIGSAGLNICAIGYPENVILNAISPTQLSLVCGDFNFISILSRVNGTQFNCIISDEMF